MEEARPEARTPDDPRQESDSDWAILLPTAMLVWLAARELGPVVAGWNRSGYPPKNLEMARYLLAVVLPPPIFLALGGGRRIVPEPWRRRLAVASRWILLAVAAVGAVAQEWGREPIFGKGILLGAAALAALAIAGKASLDRLADRSVSAPVRVAVRLLFPILALVLFAGTVYIAGGADSGHPLFWGQLPSFSGEVLAVQVGKTPLVDFYPQYQYLFSFLLAPILPGPSAGPDAAVFGFTLAMAVTGLAVCVFWFLALRVVSRGRLAPYLLACVPLVLAFEFVEDGYGFFTYYPSGQLRLLGPALLAFLLARRLASPSPRWGDWPLLVAASLVAANNLDEGLPAFAGVLLALLLTGGHRWRHATATLLRAFSALAAVVALVAAAARLRSGAWPDPRRMLLFHQRFVGEGFDRGMMADVGLHWGVWLLFAGVVIAALSAAFRRPGEQPVAIGLNAYNGVLGLGTMAYFAVRSFTEVLPGLFPLAGFTLAVLLLTSSSPPPSAVPHREGLLRGEWIPRALVVFGLCLAAISVGRLPSPAETPRHLASGSERIRRPWREAVERIRRETTRGEAVLVIAPWGDAVAREAGARNVFPFAYAASLVSARTQVPIVLEAVERNGVRFVLETPIGEPFRTRSPRPLVAALEAVGFRCDEEGGGMSCRRGAPPP